MSIEQAYLQGMADYEAVLHQQAAAAAAGGADPTQQLHGALVERALAEQQAAVEQALTEQALLEHAMLEQAYAGQLLTQHALLEQQAALQHQAQLEQQALAPQLAAHAAAAATEAGVSTEALELEEAYQLGVERARVQRALEQLDTVHAGLENEDHKSAFEQGRDAFLAASEPEGEDKKASGAKGAKKS